MNSKMINLKKVFLEKRQLLDDARRILKTEFIGIDKIIDEVVENVSSWYILSDIQEKPLVINLWGLTGVGKTSIIIRLAELIEFNDRFFRFDLGEKQGSFSFRNALGELCENNDTSPIIIALDEFQHSRTVVGPLRQEKETDHNRMIWELIDSGKVQYIDWKNGLWSFEDLIHTLHHILNAGVKVEKGIVTKRKELYCRELDVTEEKGKLLFFVPEDKYETIINLAGIHLNLHLNQDVRKQLLCLSGAETIEFLNKVLTIAKRPSVKNFSNSLIFVLGNIDEAYTMSSNFSADMDADEFHKESLKITIPKIKNALKERFRAEQVARLGNIHIIYPALNRKAYLKIIQNELKKVASNMFSFTGLSIDFDESVVDLIYKEGVYPTQGVRPIFTTIHHVLKSKFSFFLSEILQKDINPDKLLFSVEKKMLNCEYQFQGLTIYKKETEIITVLEDMRNSQKDDSQAITAVHESGHAILSAVLLKTIPEVIYSVTSDADNLGFVYSKFAWNYTSRKELIPRVAMMLGGYVAEELIFGKEHLTAGASGDIEKATEFLSTMYKKCGMGETPILYSILIPDDKDCYHNFEGVEEEIKQVLEQALELAKSTLTKEKKLLLVMADYLSDNRILKKSDIEILVNENISNQMNFITNGKLLYYRNHLKKEVEGNEVQHPPKFEKVISLNREKNENSQQ